MVATSALLSIAVNSPTELTTQGIDRWLTTLSARERADVKWMGPGIKAALATLLDGPLTRQALDTATEGFARVLLGRRRFFARLLDVDASALTIAGTVEEQRPMLMSVLGSEVLFSQLHLAVHAIDGTIQAILQKNRDMPEAQSNLDRALDLDLDELVEATMADPASSVLRAQVCVAGILEIAEGHGTAERSRDLARLALIASIDGVAAARAGGFDIALDASHFAAADFDQVLVAMARMALSDPNDAHGAAYWVQARMPQLSFPELPQETPEPAPVRFPKRLRRYVGEVAAIGFGPHPTIQLTGADGLQSFSATPELVEHALTLRGALIEAMAVIEPIPFAWWLSPLRLVRIGPAAEEPPSSALRTRDIVKDWDELLHRLAR
ncbi:MAG: hypothetical protein ABI193_10300 [Minicystis sp.]